MFTHKAQLIIDIAKDFAFHKRKINLDFEAILCGVMSDSEGLVRLSECFNIETEKLSLIFPAGEIPRNICPGKMDLSGSARDIISSASDLASAGGVPHPVHPGLIDICHIAGAIAMSGYACKFLHKITVQSKGNIINMLKTWYLSEDKTSSMVLLMSKLKEMRNNLMSRIYGQNHAVYAFIEGLYNAEILYNVDSKRKKPKALYVFAGPPGVGKTFMAQSAATLMGLPFKSFDMTGYSNPNYQTNLIGWDPSYQNASKGILTGFVAENPEAVLLFDEIEKAHLTTIQLFYQILDEGRLEDKFLHKDISFKDTIIIFTTNGGKSLYDNPNKTGISTANSNYHKRTIMSALENEKNPSDGMPAFPPAICSRLSQGYPVMFNHLGVNELEQVIDEALKHTEILLTKEYYKSFYHDRFLPVTLILNQGAGVDARQLNSEGEKFLKRELFKFASLYEKENLEDTLKEIDRVKVEVEIEPVIKDFYDRSDKFKVLLVAEPSLSAFYEKHMMEITWFSAASSEEALEILATEEINMILLDLWIRGEESKNIYSSYDMTKTIYQGQDYMSFSARSLDKGRNILRKFHELFPLIPVYLLSITGGEHEKDLKGQTVTSDTVMGLPSGEKERMPVDDELLLACIRSGGARGMISTDFGSNLIKTPELNSFSKNLAEINHRIWREKKVIEMAKERRVLNFDTKTVLDKINRQLIIKLRNFHFTRAIDASDAGEMIEDVERPATKFSDVIGGKSAKEALQFVIDWLKSPACYRGLGIRPPKGILLSGPPGTGKTMLARAVAGESNCAFIQISATSFVTQYQGSGPQNVRTLFGRARRYAPSIIFIDEIDAIGKMRTGATEAGRAEEATLNTILTEMDGFSSPSSPPVIVLSATNLVENLDSALRRRFDREILVDKPDRGERLEYLKKTLSKRKKCSITGKVMERIAARSTDMTVADLERILQEASIMSVKKSSELSDEILEEAFEKIRMGETGKKTDKESLRRIARHESGHAVMAWLGGNMPLQVTIIGRGDKGGYMEREVKEEKIIYTKSELLQRMRESLGGRASEIVYYGEEDGLSTGASGDLRNATNIAGMMVQEYGMTKEFGLISPHREHIHDGPLSLKIYEISEKIILEQLEETIKILRKNHIYLDILSEELLEKNRLTGEELEKILGKVNLL
jgi:ATP-dependent metalloprotease FtsH